MARALREEERRGEEKDILDGIVCQANRRKALANGD